MFYLSLYGIVVLKSRHASFLKRPRHQRFIGVIYRSATEIPSHYVRCRVSDQYDAVVHIKASRGLRPLEKEDLHKGLTRGELDMTYPFGE